eukprot:283600_1
MGSSVSNAKCGHCFEEMPDTYDEHGNEISPQCPNCFRCISCDRLQKYGKTHAYYSLCSNCKANGKLIKWCPQCHYNGNKTMLVGKKNKPIKCKTCKQIVRVG